VPPSPTPSLSRCDQPTPRKAKKRKGGRKRGKKAAAVPALPVSDWMTPAQCAAYRNVSVSCLNKERLRGDGPSYVKTRRRIIRYSRRAVDDWLEAQIRRSTSETTPPPICGTP